MSFQAAAETSKLLVTLATAVIAFCVTFINVEPGKTTLLTPATTGQKVLLVCSWLVLLVCAGAGVWVQLALTRKRPEWTALTSGMGHFNFQMVTLDQVR